MIDFICRNIEPFVKWVVGPMLPLTQVSCWKMPKMHILEISDCCIYWKIDWHNDIGAKLIEGDGCWCSLVGMPTWPKSAMGRTLTYSGRKYIWGLYNWDNALESISMCLLTRILTRILKIKSQDKKATFKVMYVLDDFNAPTAVAHSK